MAKDPITNWELSGFNNKPETRNTAIRLRSFYEYMANHLFGEYEPTNRVSSRNSRDFLTRLEKWLNCMDSEHDQWIAFRSIEYFFFAGTKEFNELYRCALEHCITPWLIDQDNLNIFDKDLDRKIEKSIKRCWPCPVTDSLRINGFLHITGIPGKSLRPDWLSLKELGSTTNINAYIRKKQINKLILIEDFSGSGFQIERVIKFAAENFDIPILVTPLIICADGNDRISELLELSGYDNISYKPVIVIDKSCLVGEKVSQGEPPIFRELRKVMLHCYEKMSSSIDGEEFGYSKIGSLITLYSNCPNNTPPMYHHVCSEWTPIFPRSSRV